MCRYYCILFVTCYIQIDVDAKGSRCGHTDFKAQLSMIHHHHHHHLQGLGLWAVPLQGYSNWSPSMFSLYSSFWTIIKQLPMNWVSWHL
jgi:hypothetical protein